jgi:hypothetical protein
LGRVKVEANMKVYMVANTISRLLSTLID